MKSEKEIRKRIVQAFNFIINCDKGCASKSPGLSCSLCLHMDTEVNLLSWVLGEKRERVQLKDINSA